MDDELGNQLVATMLYLDSENKKDIQLYINCSGGEVTSPYLMQTASSCLSGSWTLSVPAPQWPCMTPWYVALTLTNTMHLMSPTDAGPCIIV